MNDPSMPVILGRMSPRRAALRRAVRAGRRPCPLCGHLELAPRERLNAVLAEDMPTNLAALGAHLDRLAAAMHDYAHGPSDRLDPRQPDDGHDDVERRD